MQEEILLHKEEIATPSKIKKWKHLSSITNEIEQRNDVQVGLLIGANCMKVLEPRKIIHWGGPYAYKTRLGWCVVGPINCIRKLEAAIVKQLERCCIIKNCFTSLCNGEASQGCQSGGNVSSNVPA